MVGAGPAGIAAVGKLLDQGIPAQQILWCDPCFKVGDFGQLWSTVSSNTKAKLFTQFLEACSSFSYAGVAEQFTLSQLDPEQTCALSYMAEPLQWITDKLMQQVQAQYGMIHRIRLFEGRWHLYGETGIFRAQGVVLATGSVAANLNYAGADVIPFDLAIDKTRLSKVASPEATYAVFGSSHSAFIILRHLVEMKVKKIINFYRSPCRYAVDMGDWVLFDNTGLKGQTAQWAKRFIDGVLPDNLLRYQATSYNIERYLAECNKIIYAVGFNPRNTVVVDDYHPLQHNPHTGILAPGLFGLGIAYPERKVDLMGNVESQVGLWKFMTYLEKVIPLWLKYLP